MSPGTRVRHNADGATGVVTGTVQYLTGHTVPRVRWDDGSSVRVGAVSILPAKPVTT